MKTGPQDPKPTTDVGRTKSKNTTDRLVRLVQELANSVT